MISHAGPLLRGRSTTSRTKTLLSPETPYCCVWKVALGYEPRHVLILPKDRFILPYTTALRSMYYAIALLQLVVDTPNALVSFRRLISLCEVDLSLRRNSAMTPPISANPQWALGMRAHRFSTSKSFVVTVSRIILTKLCYNRFNTLASFYNHLHHLFKSLPQ